jgi:hypothetical protein
MSFDTPEDPRSRDTALARLLAEALKSQSKSAGHAKSTACPDAEVLATYAEHGLAEEETARWESHFADCDRCQKIISVLAASGEVLAKAEVERLGNLAAASSAAREPVVRNTPPPWVVIWRRPAFWRWLVPAVGMASAAALWFALRQVPPREALSSQKIAATSGAPQNRIDQGTTAASSAKSDETQMAPPPAVATPSAAPLRDKEKSQANSSAAARQEPVRKQESFSNALQAPPDSEADRNLEVREDTAKDNRVPSAQAAEQKSPIGDELTAAAPAAPAAAPSPSTPPPARSGDRAVPRGFDSATGAAVPAQLKALAQTVTPTIVFASPNHRALWRLGSGGRIEHSADQGQTWQPQASGVTADLLAGAAPSEKIAWVVGRAGTIVRTEDGEHWQRVAPPPSTQPVAAAVAAPDWISVEARDALHATITSRDLRRFVTEDGGRTWTQLQQ